MKTTETTAARRPAGARVTHIARPDNDRLLVLSEVAEYIRTEEETIRWWRKNRHKDAPPVWKKAGRLVAWKSEIDAWLDAQRDADMQDTGTAA